MLHYLVEVIATPSDIGTLRQPRKFVLEECPLIGHQFGEHPILMSVVALIGFNVIGTTLASICSSIGIYSGFFDSVQQIFESDTIRALYLAQGGTILFMAVQIAFFGAITWVLLDRRLNLA